MTLRRLLYLAGLVLGFALFLWQAWRGITAVPAAGLHVVSLWSLFWAVGVGILLQFIQMTGWLYVMSYLRVELALSDVIRGYNISFLPRYIPGVVWGYLGRSEWLEQEHGTSYTASMIGSFLEAAGLILSALSVAAMYAATTWLPNRWPLPGALVVLVTSLLIWGALPKLIIRSAARMATFAGKHVNLASMEQIRVARPVHWWRAGILYASFWLLSGFALWLLTRAVLPAPPNSWWDSVFAVSVSWVIGFVILFIPTGMGIREVTMTSLLGLVTGMPSWQGTTVALLARANSLIAELMWLLVAAVVSRKGRFGARKAPNLADRAQ